MHQKQFVERAKKALLQHPDIIGLAVAGSWLTSELDKYSDVDLIIVTKEKVSGSHEKMIQYARVLGNFISGFTGEHVGEPRVLICLYDDPLLHIDIKFLTTAEFSARIENPHLLIDRDGQLENIINNTQPGYPYPGFQWMEDRFWTWVHYGLLKIGRGEFVEALDFFAALRGMVLGPLLQIKNGKLPRGVRKIEELPATDVESITSTIPAYNRESLLSAMSNAIDLYRRLRNELFDDEIIRQEKAEDAVMKYFAENF